MARATNPGAPQRVSAHVVPKAPSFSSDDEEEKTTIESGGWEEEASTTVEQGEVADKVRALAIGAAQPARSNTAITSTTGSGVSDEPTVDDQRASAALALMPPPSAARLVVTQGNDAGRHLEVRPGKTYTIGRGIDNDLVLTDITASRKHFEIRHDNGAWIVADRASGNGTLINSRIEDAPFMLASGDMIEVGHTAFRFDVVGAAISLPGLPSEVPGGVREAPAGAARDARAAQSVLEDPLDSRELMPTPAVHSPRVSRELITPAVLREAATAAPPREAPGPRDAEGETARGVPDEVPSFDGSVDDDLELSTMSGKPTQVADPAAAHGAAGRPKTLPPPAPLPRPRTQTGRPPLAFAATRSQQMAVAQPTSSLPAGAIAAAMAPTISPMHAVPALPQPATTLPLPQMANRPPLAPGLLDSSLGSMLPQLTQGTSLPATLPGQGPPLPPNRGPRLPFSYGAPELAPQRSSGIMRAPVHVAAGHPGRDATSTALVQPMSYSGGQPMAAPPPAQRMVPVLSRRMLLALGLVAIAMFAAIATIAIRSTAGRARSTSPAGPAAAPATPARPPTVTPIPSAPGASSAPPSGASPAHPAPSGRAAPAGASPPLGSARPSSDKLAAAPPSAGAPPPAPAPASPAASPPTAAPAPAATAGSTPATASSPAPVHVASADKIVAPPGPSAASASSPPSRASGTAAGSPSAAPAAAGSVASDRVATKGPADGAAPSPPTAAPSPTAAGPEPAHAGSGGKAHADAGSAKTAQPAKHTEPRRREHRTEVAGAPSPRPEKRHGGRSLQDVRSEATGLYRSKNFSGASLAIKSALPGFSGDDVKDLQAIAEIYLQLGKAYTVGMAPGTKPVDAYQALLRASKFDREVGGAYTQELHDKLVAIAPRAATSYMAAKSFTQAFEAMSLAEELGSRTDDLKIVRQNLDDKAKELLRTAGSELASDPDAAKQKLHQVQGMVDRTSPLWQRAARLLSGP
ncbi:MAG TPA: FHA domain-containing protein [Kofleriaceae bacterium]|jgi:hypothetical protein|nr:FHA domain-containing protein [Kofleriaceae bacterium]